MNKNEEELRESNIHEFAILVSLLHDKRLNEIHDEAMNTFGKKFVDLRKDEIEKCSILIRREYKKAVNKIFWNMAKYADCEVMKTESSLNSYIKKFNEFKESYYKKHPNEKK